MKLKSLLLTAAAVTLAAGQASATVLTPTPISAVPAGIVPVPFGTVLANELDLSATNSVDGTFVFDLGLSFGGQLPAGDNLLVTVNLPEGLVFSSALSGNAIFAGGDGIFGGANLQSGGAVGSDSAEFLVTIDPDAANAETTIGIAVPVSVVSCPMSGAGINVEAVLAGSGIAIEGMTNGVTSTGLLSCASAKNGSVSADTDDTLILLPDYDAVDGDVIGVLDFRIGSTPTLGTPSVVPTIDFAGTAFDATDVASMTFTVQFEDLTGINNVYLRDGTFPVPGNVIQPAVLDTAANTATFTITSDANLALVLDGVADLIAFSAAGGGTAIAAQSVSISDVVCTFDDTRAEFITSETFPGAALDSLVREGQVFGFFDWNQEDGPVNSVYRITGLSTTEDTPLTVVFENSNAGQNGSFETVIAASDVNNGEYVIASRRQLADLNPGYQRADVQFNFETTNGLDVDRLISSGGVVTDFGDSANRVDIFNTDPDDPFPISDSDNGGSGTSGVVTE